MLEDHGLKGKMKFVKKIGLLLSGIVLGLIFIGVIILALDYFKIIDVPVALKFYNLESSAKNIEKPEKIIPMISTPIYQNAEKAGYGLSWEISFKNYPEDFSGRSILASKKRVVNGWIDKFGLQTNQSGKDNSARVTGMFIGWIKINGSNDRYMVIKDMFKKEDIRIRVLFGLSSAYEDLKNGTILSVDNLDYGPLNSKIEPIKKIDYINNILDEKLNAIIRMGDIVCAFIPVDNTYGKTDFIRDKYGEYIAEELQIRRFKGMETIDKELK